MLEEGSGSWFEDPEETQTRGILDLLDGGDVELVEWTRLVDCWEVKREEEDFGNVANDVEEECWNVVCWEVMDDRGVDTVGDVTDKLLSKMNGDDVVGGAERWAVDDCEFVLLEEVGGVVTCRPLEFWNWLSGFRQQEKADELE